MPVTVPYNIIGLGSFIAIFFGKMIWGGLGRNLFNPALFSRLILMLLFPVYLFGLSSLDGSAGASNITEIKQTGIIPFVENSGGILGVLKNIVLGSRVGAIGETSFLAITIGYLYLVKRKIIDYKVPIIFVVAMLIMTLFFPSATWYGVFFGGGFFGAVFMLTDSVTSPLTAKGKYIYLIVLAILASCIIYITGLPYGFTLSILLMNLTVPIIDKLVKPRVFGKA